MYGTEKDQIKKRVAAATKPFNKYLFQQCMLATVLKSLTVFDMKDREDTVFVAGLPQRERRV